MVSATHINNSSFRGGVSEAVWDALRLYTPTWESTAVILLGGLHYCVSVMVLNKGRSPQNCMDAEWVSARLVDTILRDDDNIN